ncbi:hypothetical protein [Brevundimonas sp.]|uniref:hypothetical protein n=1 Tax=Brevundimonas sp. TaxID=1871086 RepID=UPI0025C441B9|nr:hypothetical protein [Brevundimonas sp.]
MRRFLGWVEDWRVQFVSGMGAFAALAILLRPGLGWTPDWAALSAFVAAFGVWILSTLRAAVPKSHPSDVRLFGDIEATITHDERQFLRQHDFLNEFLPNRLAGSRRVYADWDGPRYNFLDKKLNTEWLKVRSLLSDFYFLIVRDTAPMRGNVDFQTVRTSRGEDVTHQEHQEAKGLNTAASALAGALDRFEVIARTRLNV